MGKEFESNGVNVEIPDELESVVALEYSFVEALAKLELNVTGIADDKDKNNLENSIKHLVGNYTSVGSRLEPDTELIKKAEPQLILADKTRHESMFEKLNTAAPTVLLESFDANYDQSIETFKQIAELVSKEDKGRELVVQHNEKVEDLSKDIKLDKDVSTIAAVPTHDGLYVHASHSYVGQFLQKVGFNGSIPEDMENHLPEYMGADYLKVDTDRFASFNPERILIMVDEDNKADYEKLKESEAWSNIEAVRNDRVHDVNRERWAKYRGLIASELILEDLTNIEE
ncbi:MULTISPECIES: ABC transporter substrate-binding protein [Staphylococcus]|jgi:iron complex transport system substrate-binding protein|uniref:ABC transporter substrate-binding protein n=1 Tax=Staphylococcus TaxID=1279 RepID=UPI00066E1D91|nr:MULTISPECIES: ABC transporter substrate-binding protein [Staphylococcus]MDU6960816.1 ABC transporter substrate-binding protein [Staphylococcus sp.]OFK81628.1 iron citrate ABC transporter substrate-binding protein [Staphylococcus sp. HMSC057A02]OFM60201.1 iron citrate ABC transporter substrate-binding protein [Staphylococcus sp. HMSC062C01]OFM66074.1 iron citrate ABC transporter substrate-binding protein [Staphylococcus sp. HMSC068D07]OFR09978.1 iron citrate ABC transporter substrate-binding